jgi:hypothetical protein
MLSEEDRKQRDAWLERMKVHPFKHMIYCGKEITIADVERWLRDSLGQE